MRQWMGAALLAGCATVGPAPGPVVTRVSQEARVCLDGGRLRAGDEVHFVRRTCRPLSPKSSAVTCSAEPVDGGEVMRVDDRGCAVVQLGRDSQVRAGDELVASQ